MKKLQPKYEHSDTISTTYKLVRPKDEGGPKY